jgi:energy-coupling factor transport system ATP-binding protein
VTVREARDRLRGTGLVPAAGAPAGDAAGEAAQPAASARPAARLRARFHRPSAALELRGVWHEIPDGPAILRGVDLRIEPGERVALMGRNGAGKSTLLRHARGLIEPTRGRVDRAGEVALLLQNPGDYLVHERVEDEVGAAGLAAAGLAGRERANPRDLSSGERQRLALEIVLGGGAPAVACLDEPTRGMDRAHKDSLAARLRELAERGCAVLVATHDTELAAELADRIVLLGQGTVIADGPAVDVLAGGRHFTTDVARVLDGAALTPDEGAALLRRELVG